MQNNSAVTNSINFLKSNIEMALYWEYMDNTRILAMLADLNGSNTSSRRNIAATTTPSAFAYQKKKGSQDGSENGNTVTPQNNKQDGIVSGFDNSFNQELQNLIVPIQARPVQLKAVRRCDYSPRPAPNAADAGRRGHTSNTAAASNTGSTSNTGGTATQHRQH